MYSRRAESHAPSRMSTAYGCLSPENTCNNELMFENGGSHFHVRRHLKCLPHRNVQGALMSASTAQNVQGTLMSSAQTIYSTWMSDVWERREPFPCASAPEMSTAQEYLRRIDVYSTEYTRSTPHECLTFEASSNVWHFWHLRQNIYGIWMSDILGCLKCLTFLTFEAEYLRHMNVWHLRQPQMSDISDIWGRISTAYECLTF